MAVKIYSSGKDNKDVNKKKTRPALTPEAQENRMISLAIDLAETMLRNGTASSQIIAHYLKLGSTEDRLKLEILEKQKELLVAKTEQIKSAARTEAVYAEALKAMKSYSGQDEDDEDEF